MENSKAKEIILRGLRENSRLSLSELSRTTGIPLQSLLSASRVVEKRFVTRFASLIEPREIGYSIRVNYLLKERRSGLREFLEKHQNVNTCSRLMDEGMFYAECFFKEMKELDNFREAVLAMKTKIVDEAFVTEELKREGFMCDI